MASYLHLNSCSHKNVLRVMATAIVKNCYKKRSHLYADAIALVDIFSNGQLFLFQQRLKYSGNVAQLTSLT
jgi:hypothetical protein